MLYDINKTNEDRSSPLPNRHDQLDGASIKNFGTLSSHYDSNANPTAGRLQFQNQRIIINDGTTNIGLLGYNSNLGQWGFFETQPGSDVTKTTNIGDFIFSSNMSLQIVQQGRTTIPGVASPSPNVTATTSVQITHGLGYAPCFMCYAYVPTIDWWGNQLYNQTIQMPAGYNVTSGNKQNYNDLMALADSNYLTIYNNYSTGSSPLAEEAIPVTYYLFTLSST